MSDTLISEKLREMAKLTMLSGNISSTQEDNLKKYPFIFFNNVKKVKINYNLSRTQETPGEEFSISYHLELDEKNNDNLNKRFFATESAVRSLFWNNIVVKIYFNDKIVYKSDNNVKKQQ